MAADNAVEIRILGVDGLSKPAGQASKALDGLRGAAKTATASVDDLGKSGDGLGSLIGKLGLAATAMAALAGAGGLVTSTIGKLSEMEQVGAKFQAFTKDAAATKAILAEVRAEADKTPFAFREMADAAASLMPVAKSSGVALMELVRTAEILAASNPAQGLAGAAFSLREALTGDFVSIIDRFNLSREAINRLKAEGVPALEIVRRAMQEMGYDADLVANMAGTLSGRWSTFMDTLDSISMKVGQPLFDGLKRQLEQMQGWLDTNKSEIDGWADEGSRAMEMLVSFAEENLPRMADIAEGAWNLMATVTRGHQKTMLEDQEGFVTEFVDLFGFGLENMSTILNLAANVLQGNWIDAWAGITSATRDSLNQMIDDTGKAVKVMAKIVSVLMPPFGLKPGAAQNIDAMVDSLVAFGKAARDAGMIPTPMGAASGGPKGPRSTFNYEQWQQEQKKVQGAVKKDADFLKKLNADTISSRPDWRTYGIPTANDLADAFRSIEPYREKFNSLKDEISRSWREGIPADFGTEVVIRANELADATKKAGKAGTEGGAAVRDLVSALVATHPAALAAGAAIQMWASKVDTAKLAIEANQESIRNLNLAIRANQDQLKAAQADLAGMQEQLQGLQNELQSATQRLQEFTNPRLTGMGQLEMQVNAIQEQLKRVQLAKLLGVPLSQIIAQFPRLTRGAEGYLATLPDTEKGLRKVLEQLQLQQGLSFDEKMRLLADASKAAAREMDFGAALSGVQAARAQVESLTAAISAQEQVIKGQEAVVRAIQAQGEVLQRALRDANDVGEALNRQLTEYQAGFTGAQASEQAVIKGLTQIYQYILTDRAELLKMGPAGAAAAAQVDEQVRVLWEAFSTFTVESTTSAAANIQANVSVYEAAVNTILSKLAEIPTDIITTVHVQYDYQGKTETVASSPAVTIPETRDSGGPVRAGRAYRIGTPEIFIPQQSGQIIPLGGAQTSNVTVDIDYDRLAEAIARQPITLEMDGERVALVVRRQLQARGAGGLGH